ncbi:uncharacterized protein TNCV_1050851 [Trichonephila clavipes]|nr:uncharacterized protein TNCV_1050851 [Trichonephila clavipes]
MAKTFLDSTLTVTPHKSLNCSRGVISESNLLCASEAEILEGLCDHGVTQEVLGPVDPRYVIYPKTRLRTPLAYQSSRRSHHCMKCTRTDNCFINRHSVTCSTFIRDPCVFSSHTKAPGLRTVGIGEPITCSTLDVHSLTPPFGGVPRTRKTGRQQNDTRSS